MIAVSNTTPLRYLIAIGHENLLGQLFEKVFVPVAVHEELTESKTPENVRRRILSLPVWFEVRTVREAPASAFPVILHRGEREAILLAETLRSDVLLIDEQIGRTIALSRNLPLSGTLGVLERADTMGLVANFPEVLKQLKASGFFIAESLEQQLLQRSHGIFCLYRAGESIREARGPRARSASLFESVEVCREQFSNTCAASETDSARVHGKLGLCDALARSFHGMTFSLPIIGRQSS